MHLIEWAKVQIPLIRLGRDRDRPLGIHPEGGLRSPAPAVLNEDEGLPGNIANPHATGTHPCGFNQWLVQTIRCKLIVDMA